MSPHTLLLIMHVYRNIPGYNIDYEIILYLGKIYLNSEKIFVFREILIKHREKVIF